MKVFVFGFILFVDSLGEKNDMNTNLFKNIDGRICADGSEELILCTISKGSVTVTDSDCEKVTMDVGVVM